MLFDMHETDLYIWPSSPVLSPHSRTCLLPSQCSLLRGAPFMSPGPCSCPHIVHSPPFLLPSEPHSYSRYSIHYELNACYSMGVMQTCLMKLMHRSVSILCSLGDQVCPAYNLTQWNPLSMGPHSPGDTASNSVGKEQKISMVGGTWGAIERDRKIASAP